MSTTVFLFVAWMHAGQVVNETAKMPTEKVCHEAGKAFVEGDDQPTAGAIKPHLPRWYLCVSLHPHGINS
jgi:hypothetical protein